MNMAYAQKDGSNFITAKGFFLKTERMECTNDPCRSAPVGLPWSGRLFSPGIHHSIKFAVHPTTFSVDMEQTVGK